MRVLAALLGLVTAGSTAAGEVVVNLSNAGPDGSDLTYLAATPQELAPRWPLLIFLHGRGEVGGDLDQVTVHGPIKAAVDLGPLPFLVIAPHLTVDVYWDPLWVRAVIDDARDRWPVDPERIYLTGLSLGGHGTWDTAAAYPDLFAAIAPISGQGNPEGACRLRDTPIWSFHGDRDDVVPAAGNQAMVDAVRACGGMPELTLYPDRGHDAWSETYASPRLYSWLLSHSRAGSR